MSVVIAGAGIGGLTLGLTLHQLGIPFRIYEAVKEIRPLGVGINVQPHAIRELFELGLEPELEAAGLRTREVAYFSAQGGEIWREPRGTFAGYNWPQYAIHRGEMQMLLLRALRARAGADCLRMGAAARSWTERDGGVAVSLEDRTSGADLGEVQGDLLVAADGINSRAGGALPCGRPGPLGRDDDVARGHARAGLPERAEHGDGRAQGLQVRLLPDP